MKNLSTLVHYFNEREWIRQQRAKGELPPWTDDPIFQNWRFTNVHREDDRVSIQLADAMLADDIGPRMLFNSVVFRTFNCLSGYRAANGYIHKFNREHMLRSLDAAKRQGITTFHNAYMMVSTQMKKGEPKHKMYVEQVFPLVWKDRRYLFDQIQKNSSLRATAELFTRYPAFGDFISYEIALDMLMLGILTNPKDKFTWANPGPGARKGLNYIYDRRQNFTQKTELFIQEMQDLLEEVPKYLETHVKGPIDMRCIENSLCEISKYARIQQTGKGRRKYAHRS